MPVAPPVPPALTQWPDTTAPDGAEQPAPAAPDTPPAPAPPAPGANGLGLGGL